MKYLACYILFLSTPFYLISQVPKTTSVKAFNGINISVEIPAYSTWLLNIESGEILLK